MKVFLPLTILLLFFQADLFSQDPCGEASDEPPGCFLCGPVYSGSTAGYSPGTPGALFPCGGIQNNLWLSFIAGSSTVTASAVATECVQNEGIQFLIYDQNLNPVSTCFSPPGINIPGQVFATGLTPGEVYWIMVDGYNGDICEFTLSLVGGFNTSPPAPHGPIRATPDFSPLCPGVQICYEIDPVANATDYEWTIPGNATILSGGDGFPQICLIYDSPGGGVVCVTPSNGCFPGIPACKVAVVLGIPPTIKPLRWVCKEDWPVVIDGNVFTGPGTYEISYTNRNGCDSVVTYFLSEYPQIPGLIDTVKCAESVLFIHNQPIDTAGVFEVTLPNADRNGCDSLIIVRVLEFDPAAVVATPRELDCNRIDTVTIDGTSSSSGNNVTYQWSVVGAGMVIPPTNQNTVRVNNPGTYVLTVRQTRGNTVCIDRDTVVVKRKAVAINTPVFSNGATSVCAGSTGNYTVTPVNGATGYNWTVPAGATFTGGGVSINVNFGSAVGGQVCVVATGVCGNSQPACLPITVNQIPTADFTANSPICLTNSTTVQYTGNASPNANFQWNFNGGTPANVTGPGPHNISWGSSGIRNVSLVVEENGCTSVQRDVQIDVQPVLQAPVISCNSDQTSVSFSWLPVVGANNYTIYINGANVGTQGGTSYVSSNLTPGTSVTIRVIANTSSVCGTTETTATCVAQDCPVVSLNIDPVADICRNAGTATIQLTANPSDPGGTLVWNGSGVSSTGIFDPNNAVFGSNTISLTYTNNTCIYTESININVFDVPTADFTVESPICQTDAANIVYNGTASGSANFSWNFNGGVIQNGGTGGGPYEIGWATGGNFNVQLQVTENGCTSSNNALPVRVDVPLAAPQIICDATTTGISFSWAAVPGATNYRVISGAGGAYDPATRTYTVNSLQPGDQVTIEVIAEGNTACGDSRATVTCQTSNCPADVVNIAPVGPFCKDGNSPTVNLTATMQSGDNAGTFTWSGPGVTSNTFNPNSPSVGAGTVNIRATYTKDNCTWTGTIPVTINAQPDADFTVEGPICVDNTSTIAYSGSAGTGALYNWDFGGGNIQSGSGAGPLEINWNAPGNQTVTLTVEENNCVSIIETRIVQVDDKLPKPVVSCDASINNINFTWAPVIGANNYSVRVLSGNSGTYDGSLGYSVTGLLPNDRVQIEVTANGTTVCGPTRDTLECVAQSCPNIILNIPRVTPFCLYPATPNATINLDSMLIVQGSSGTANRTWHDCNNGNGYITRGGQFYPYQAGVGRHSVCVEWEEPIGSGCIKTATQTIEVNPIPSFTWGVTPRVCVNDTADVAVIAAPANSNFTWDFGNATVISGSGNGPFRLLWNNAGTGIVEATCETNGCISDATRNVTIDSELPIPVIDCNSTNTSVDFSWQPIPGANDYDITVLAGGTPAGQTNGSVSFAGLVPNTSVTIQLSVRDSFSACPPTVVERTCIAKQCPTSLVEINPVTDTCLVSGVPKNIQLSARVTNDPGNGTGQFIWSGQNVNASGLFTPGNESSYQVLVTYEYDGCTFNDAATINMYQTPLADFAVETPICETSASTVNFTGTASANAQFRWDFGTGTANGGNRGPFDVNWPLGNGGLKNISLTVIANGCTSTPASKQVQVDVPLPAPVISCDNAFNTSSITYSWSSVPGATGYEILIDRVLQPGGPQSGTSFDLYNLQPGTGRTITVRALGNTVCPPSEASQFCITDICPPSCLITDVVDPICLEANTVDLYVLATDTCNYNGSGAWTGRGVSAIGLFSPKTAGVGTHTLTYTYDYLGECKVTATLDITINAPPVADAGADQTIDCIQTSAQLGGNSSNVGFYEWTLNGALVGSNRNLNVQQSGVYTLHVEDTFTGCSDTDDVLVDIAQSDPQLHASLDSISCFGRNDGVIQIDSVSGGEPGFLYSFNGGAFAPTARFSNLGAGTYTVVVQDANGCQDTVRLGISEPNELTLELQIFDQNGILLDGTQPVNLGDSVILKAISSYTEDLLGSVNWTPTNVIPLCDEITINNCLQVSYHPTGQTFFTVRVETKTGCAADDDGQVNVKKVRPVYIPSGFSPSDQDGINDIFTVFGNPRLVTKVKTFMVFDRWGEPVFEAFDFQPCQDGICNVGWDGTFKGKKFNSGVFVYFAEVEFFDGVVEIFKGDVTIR